MAQVAARTVDEKYGYEEIVRQCHKMLDLAGASAGSEYYGDLSRRVHDLVQSRSVKLGVKINLRLKKLRGDAETISFQTNPITLSSTLKEIEFLENLLKE